jgi:hypothetical protein
MPVTARGSWNLTCLSCRQARTVPLESLEWTYEGSFEPSLLVLVYYRASVDCLECRTPLKLVLEFSSRGGGFETPVLLVGEQRLQPVEASCDGAEFWAEQ